MEITKAQFKGWYHALLSVAAGAEALHSRDKVRRALLWGAASWHAYHTWDHFVNEDKNNKDLFSCIGYPHCDGELIGMPHTYPCPMSPKHKPLTFSADELDNYPCTAAEEVAKKKRKKNTKKGNK